MKFLKTYKLASVVFAGATLLASCSNDDTTDTSTITIPETITIAETGLYPEGIDFNNNTNQFIIGSITRSEIVDTQTGAYTTLVSDPKLASVAGVYTDETRNRLLAVSGNLGFSANSDSNPASLAYLGIYNLETGDLIQGISLQELLPEGSPTFANDIAVDTEGNIYVTDSFSPVIYKVDGATFEASILVNGGADFTPAPMGFGLNGLVFIDGYLVVCKLDDGALFKVPVADPTNYTKISAPAYIGADGLEVDANGNIILVENALGQNPGTHVLTSSDNWDTATEVSSFNILADKFPTTATLANDGNVYVLNSYLSKALGGDFSQETFSVLLTK